MPKDDHIIIKGTVVKANGKGFFTVKSEESENETHLVCTLSGNIRRNAIKVLQGDSVEVAISPYDMGRGIITYRTKKTG